MFRIKCGCGIHATYRSEAQARQESEWGRSEKAGICEECYRALPPDAKGRYVRRTLSFGDAA